MTPQEKDLLTNLADRLRKAPPQQKDAEAEALIRDTVAAQPDAPYLLAQTVLIQDYALSQAQGQVADLKKQLEAAKAAPAAEAPHSGGFLSGLFGRGGDTRTPAAPAAGPWNGGNSAASPAPAAGQPGFMPQQGGGGPWAQQQQPMPQQGGMFGGGGMMGQQQGPSFLQSAATTALGIAGGAMLFQGISSMFGGHSGGGLFGGGQHQASLSEQSGLTPGYGSDGGNADAGGSDSSQPYADAGSGADGGWDQGGYAPPDPGYDPGYAPQSDTPDPGWSGGDTSSDWSSDDSGSSGGGDDWT